MTDYAASDAEATRRTMNSVRPFVRSYHRSEVHGPGGDYDVHRPTMSAYVIDFDGSTGCVQTALACCG